jgi:dCMP deaminase
MGSKAPRLSFDEFCDVVTLICGTRGTCDRLRTATTLWSKEKVLLSLGYNGAISKDPHCDDPGVGHLLRDGHCIRTNHGEDNALLNCLNLSLVEDGTATMLGSPCYPCARKLIGKGIKRLRYIGAYENSLGGSEVEKLCRNRGILFEFVKPEEVLCTLQKAFDFLSDSGGPFKDLGRMMIVCNPVQDKKIIGLAGRMGAGKGTAVEVIQEFMDGICTVSTHRTSDPLNKFLQESGIEVSRQNQQLFSKNIRAAFGEYTFGNTIKQRALRDAAKLVCIDGIRRPLDVVVLRDLNAPLILVDADPKVRFERIKTRDDRVGEKDMTWEQFLERDDAESEQAIATLPADFKIDNSGDMYEIKVQIFRLLTDMGFSVPHPCDCGKMNRP